MGIAYRFKDDYDRSLEMHAKALAVFQSTVGENHPDTALTYNNMGYAYYERNGEGDRARAREMFAKAVAIRTATLGADHADTKRAQRMMDACG